MMQAFRSPHLALPFFDDAHRDLAPAPGAWAPQQTVDEHDDRAACRQWVRRLGDAGWLRYCVPASSWRRTGAAGFSRALVILRETLAFSIHRWLTLHLRCRAWAVAPSRWPARGSNPGGLSAGRGQRRHDRGLCLERAGRRLGRWPPWRPPPKSGHGTHVTLNGCKTWISNGGIADFYCVFAKTDPAAWQRGAYRPIMVDATTPGLDASESILVMAPHPLATLALSGLPGATGARNSARPTVASSSRCRRWTSSVRRWPGRR
jgi:acyl-CoA dehydrogenase